MRAALGQPGAVGSSGTVESQVSSSALKCSTVPSMLLSSRGIQLKSFAPLTEREASRAFLTGGGDLAG